MEYPKGIKWTKQRKCVYQILSEAKEPLSAHQIYHQALQMVPEDTYALSTVYRILAAFEENGLVNSTTWMGEDTVVYDLSNDATYGEVQILDVMKTMDNRIKVDMELLKTYLNR